MNKEEFDRMVKLKELEINIKELELKKAIENKYKMDSGDLKDVAMTRCICRWAGIIILSVMLSISITHISDIVDGYNDINNKKALK